MNVKEGDIAYIDSPDHEVAGMRCTVQYFIGPHTCPCCGEQNVDVWAVTTEFGPAAVPDCYLVEQSKFKKGLQ